MEGRCRLHGGEGTATEEAEFISSQRTKNAGTQLASYFSVLFSLSPLPIDGATRLKMTLPQLSLSVIGGSSQRLGN